MGSCLSFGEDSFSPIRDYAGGNKDLIPTIHEDAGIEAESAVDR